PYRIVGVQTHYQTVPERPRRPQGGDMPGMQQIEAPPGGHHRPTPGPDRVDHAERPFQRGGEGRGAVDNPWGVDNRRGRCSGWATLPIRGPRERGLRFGRARGAPARRVRVRWAGEELDGGGAAGGDELRGGGDGAGDVLGGEGAVGEEAGGGGGEAVAGAAGVAGGRGRGGEDDGGGGGPDHAR